MTKRFGSYVLIDGFLNCPLKGCCTYAGIQCNNEVCCSWLEYETRVQNLSKHDISSVKSSTKSLHGTDKDIIEDEKEERGEERERGRGENEF